MTVGKKSSSPCIRNCCLDNNDVCLGCFRKLDEILAWQSYTDKEQKDIVQLCDKRKTEKANKLV